MAERRVGPSALRIAALTAVAMVAFAANSLLCRLALDRGAIDAASFSSIRLLAGAVALAVILQLRRGEPARAVADWWAAAMLFTYVAMFSFAYLSLSAGTGALILFGAVQLTMFGVGLYSGERFRASAWFGLALAAGGLVYLVSPGLAAPPLAGAAMMAVAGIAWGVYSLRGRGVTRPLAATAGNFARCVPVAALLAVVALANGAHASAAGIALAAASGGIASGLGYSLWYAAVPALSATQAAVVQLSVPVITALAAVVLLAEPLRWPLAIGGAAIVGGLAIALRYKGPRSA